MSMTMTEADARRARRSPWRTIAAWLDRPLASFHLLLAVFVIMLGFGLTMVLSSSSTDVAFNKNVPSAFSGFANQALFAVLGLIGFIAVMRMPLGLLRRISTVSVIVSLGLLVAVLIPGIGVVRNGAQSWIEVPPIPSFQPSEVAKLALLVWAAHVMAARRGPRMRFRELLFPVVPVFAIMGLLIMLQPDLGTTVTLVVVFLAVMYFGGAQLWIFAGLIAAGGLGVWVLANAAGYRVERLTAWLHPELASDDSTYQSFQGLYAMGSGGVFGVGLGSSRMKWGRLPNADSDFIFAIIGEELGLIGTLTVIVLFTLLTYVGLRIARRNTDPFIKIVAAAGTVWLVGQAAINVGYVVGLLPVTGLPLPMFSRGGTSLVVTMVVFGLLANFARREPQAVAALHGTAPRGLAAFLGLGRGRSPARGGSARSQRRAQRRAERVRQQRALAAQQARLGTAAWQPGAMPRSRDGATESISRPPRRAAPRQKRYPVRRALGFPVPAQRGGDARTSPAGRMVRP